MPGSVLLLLGVSAAPSWANPWGGAGNPWRVWSLICSSHVSPACLKGWGLWLWLLQGVLPSPPFVLQRLLRWGCSPADTAWGPPCMVSLGSCLASLVELLSLKAGRDVTAHSHRLLLLSGIKGVALLRNLGNASLELSLQPWALTGVVSLTHPWR